MKPALNPLLGRLAAYLQEKANAQRETAARSGKPLYDFGIGDPREPTPEFIRKALREAVPEVSQYPSISGMPVTQGPRPGVGKRCVSPVGDVYDMARESTPERARFTWRRPAWMAARWLGEGVCVTEAASVATDAASAMSALSVRADSSAWVAVTVSCRSCDRRTVREPPSHL